MKKYYAVKIGKKRGVYQTWEECKANVDGYPNASYKAFKTYKEAEAFISEKDEIIQEANIENIMQDEQSNDVMIAYIDGSYEDNIKYYSYAAIIFYQNKRYEFCKRENNPEILSMRNVAGELRAAIKTMQCALKVGVKELHVYYDYAGIEKWATGEWKAKNNFTKAYAQFTVKVSQSVKVRFFKVEAHTGNKHNEEVDKLAKEALYSISGNEQQNSNVKELNLHSDEECRVDISTSIKESLVASKLSNLKISYIFDTRIVTDKELVDVFKKKWKLLGYKQKEIKGVRVALDIIQQRFFFIAEIESKEVIVEIRGEEL